MNFFRRFKIAWASTKHLSFKELPGDFWNEADSRTYLSFMNTPAGSKMKLLLANFRIGMACDAVRNETNQTYQCGIAQGVALTLGYLDQHLPTISSDATDSIESEIQEDGALEFLERSSP